MELGFETIGNATLICHDNGPVLVTDPWTDGDAYFGSWTLSHEIPDEQRQAIIDCPFVWLSHGHPDHLSMASLEKLRSRTLLVPNHVGGRIRDDLQEAGFRVQVLADRQWTRLSPRIRVLCLPDVNQDAVLLVEVGGRLIVNLNDAGDRGQGRFVRRVIKEYSETYLLALSGYGDADMMNFFTEDGNRILPYAAAKTPVGQTIARMAETYGVRYFVPFSSMHKYQRADSVWCSEYTTTLPDYARGFASTTCEMLPAFLRRDFTNDSSVSINPKERAIKPVDPKDYGDDWSECLDADEAKQLEQYFRAVEHLGTVLDFVRFRVGGKDHVIEFNKRRFHKGITFDAPRNSLMTAVKYQVFDDLLIGNFMKTTVHGGFGKGSLYPDFSPYVAKYADNGKARTAAELRNYFNEYRSRDMVGYLRHQLDAHCVRPLQIQSAELLRTLLPPGSNTFRMAKETYWKMRRAIL
ncbi:MBL fold metallo-hydrolase [Corallococcus exercitus]|uniref:MBL fold metallo-hydrolase n=1 Tax=Corallococcus exercitus TaxID=2316736 RepID=A0A7Y4KLW6_9BACT|nr:MBL fold metallo-hydrolase [Corallococcus exercitus]NOK36243.1 MBL fold metallo-hydrolase [Corallococcus exercitus]